MILTRETLEDIESTIKKHAALDKRISKIHNTYKQRGLYEFPSADQSDPVQKARTDMWKMHAEVRRCTAKEKQFERELRELDNKEIESIIRYHYLRGYDWQETCKAVYGFKDDSFAKRTLIGFLAECQTDEVTLSQTG
ncbi:MAG: hypothetical protein E7194_00060 [Erysipelotrichaceae bacterium]|nr:hypothetical protein [Erysipelotrichaceae bacterium]